jgi:hypothetical protein
VENDIEDIIYRIISGFYYIEVDGTVYKIVLPKLSVKHEAQNIYRLALNRSKFDDGWISSGEIENYLKYFNIWNNDKAKLLEGLPKELNKYKIQLYLNFNHPENKKQIKETIKSLNKQINELTNDKQSFDYLSLDSYALGLKNQFIISQTVYHNNELVFNGNFEDTDSTLLEKIILEIHRNSLSAYTLKTISRHDLWKSYWDASKERIFKSPAIEWTDEQISLINLSKMLDSIREHPECPNDEIIADFDALDGWLLHQQEKMEKEKKKQAISDKYGLDKQNGSEVFLVTDSVEETKEIYSLNSREDNYNIKTMHQAVKEKGEMKWSEVPHVQRQLKQEQVKATQERQRRQ